MPASGTNIHSHTFGLPTPTTHPHTLPPTITDVRDHLLAYGLVARTVRARFPPLHTGSSWTTVPHRPTRCTRLTTLFNPSRLHHDIPDWCVHSWIPGYSTPLRLRTNYRFSLPRCWTTTPPHRTHCPHTMLRPRATPLPVDGCSADTTHTPTTICYRLLYVLVGLRSWFCRCAALPDVPIRPLHTLPYLTPRIPFVDKTCSFPTTAVPDSRGRLDYRLGILAASPCPTPGVAVAVDGGPFNVYDHELYATVWLATRRR